MTTRTDVVPDYYDSPRVLEVQAPSTEMTMQDYVDTVRKLEDSFAGMSFKKLTDASGKENLGGGVQVGITVSQQNTKLAFEGRTTPAETGTVTSNPGSAVTGLDSFIDTAADFVAANVARGSLVVNWSDRSIAEVYRVDSATQLTTKTLVNGVGNTYDVTDIYHVYNIVQCNATGGNLVAVDEAQAPIPAILPTAFTQVVLTASASATTQNQESLNFATYQNGVSYDPTNSTGLASTGTEFPAGTPQQPSLLLSDVLTIAGNNGFKNIYVRGNATFGATDNVDNFVLEGDGPQLSVMIFVAGCSTSRTIIRRTKITGTVDGALELFDCQIEALAGVGGITADTTLKECLLKPGTVITMSNTATFPVNIIECDSGSPGDAPVTVDWNGNAALDAVIRSYAGGMRLINITGGQEISFDGDAHLTIDVSNTDGTIAVRGDVKITNEAEANPNFIVDIQTSAATVWEYVVDGTFTAEEVLRLVASAAAAKASGLDLLTPEYRDLADTKNRISATTDISGNRLTITYDVSQ